MQNIFPVQPVKMILHMHFPLKMTKFPLRTAKLHAISYAVQDYVPSKNQNIHRMWFKTFPHFPGTTCKSQIEYAVHSRHRNSFMFYYLWMPMFDVRIFSSSPIFTPWWCIVGLNTDIRYPYFFIPTMQYFYNISLYQY